MGVTAHILARLKAARDGCAIDSLPGIVVAGQLRHVADGRIGCQSLVSNEAHLKAGGASRVLKEHLQPTRERRRCPLI